MEQINLKLLAKKLNLSMSSVSKALKDSHEISAATKQRVLKLVKELNYVPNPHASSLRKHQSKVIAVILPEISNTFFTQVINGIESITREKGYHILIYLTHEDYETEVSIIKHLHNGRVDGVLMSLSSTTTNVAHLKELHKKKIPLIFFDRSSNEIATGKVITNDFQSAYDATRLLIEKGCERIACLHLSKKLSVFNNRLEGYLQALKDHNIIPDKKLIINCNHDDQHNQVIIQKAFKGKNRPDGCLTTTEDLAFSTYNVCKELSIEIPKELKIISFSNLEVATLLNPALATIHQPAFEMGKEASMLLFKALKNNDIVVDETIVIDSQIFKRMSTAD